MCIFDFSTISQSKYGTNNHHGGVGYWQDKGRHSCLEVIYLFIHNLQWAPPQMTNETFKSIFIVISFDIRYDR